MSSSEHSLFPISNPDGSNRIDLKSGQESSLIKRNEVPDITWMQNASAQGDILTGQENSSEQIGVTSDDKEASSPWSDESEHISAKKESRKSKKRKSKHPQKRKRKRRILSDREKIFQIEEKLANLEKHKRTRKLRLYYWGNDFDVDVDVRKQKTIWADDKNERKSFVDRVGNNDNLLYEQLYRLDIPNYKSVHDFFLGDENLPKYLVRAILKDRGAGEVFDEVKQSSNYRYFARKYDLQDRDRSLRRIYVGKSKYDVNDEASEFIPLAVEGDPDWKDGGQTFEEKQFQRTRDLSVGLREDPHNIALWFEFIRFQEETQPGHRSNKSAPVLEKKISIFEKAIEKNPGSIPLTIGYLETCRLSMTPDDMIKKWDLTVSRYPSSSRLWREYLMFRQSNFETFSILSSSNLYKDAIKKLASMKYELPTGKRETRNYEEAIVSLLVRNIMLLKQAGYLEKAVALFQALLEYNLNCPSDLIDTEKKVQFFEGFWDSDCPRLGDECAPTWKGWYEQQTRKYRGEVEGEDCSYNDSLSRTIAEKEQKVMEEELRAFQNEDSIVLWAAREKAEERIHWQPMRNIEENEIDIDDISLQRVVLMDDIRPFLCEIRNRQLLADMACELLIMLGVPRQVIGGMYRLSSYRFSLERAQELERYEDVPGLDGKEIYFDFFEFPVHHDELQKTKCQVLPERPPTGINFLKRSMSSSFISESRFSESKVEFCRRLLRSLTSGAFSNSISLRCTHIAFEAQYSFDQSCKEAKSFLKIDQMNLRLWNAYAQLQKLYHKHKEASRLYKKALKMVPQLPHKNQRDAPLLFWSYAEIQIFHLRNTNAASHILSASPFYMFETLKFKKPVKATAFIKAKKMFLRLIGDLPSASPSVLQKKWDNSDYDPRSWNIWSVAASSSQERSQRYIEISPGACLSVSFAWMEYFRAGLDEAMSVFKEYIFSRVRDSESYHNSFNAIKRGSFQHEWLNMAYVRLLSYHDLMNPTPPRILRDALSSSLKIFPANAYLICTLIKREGEKSHMTTRLRRHFDAVLDNQGGANEVSPMLWLYAVAWEFSREGARHRLINLFEKALRGTSRCVVAIWRLYIRYLISIGQLEAAKSTYYRAFHQCPWSKMLWLDGLCLLKDAEKEQSIKVLSNKEFMDIANIMIEKELRFHTNLNQDV